MYNCFILSILNEEDCDVAFVSKNKIGERRQMLHNNSNNNTNHWWSANHLLFLPLIRPLLVLIIVLSGHFIAQKNNTEIYLELNVGVNCWQSLAGVYVPVNQRWDLRRHLNVFVRLWAINYNIPCLMCQRTERLFMIAN